MHRAIPVSNKLLSKKWDDRNQAVHEEKLRSMRPTVDSATPVTFPHAVSKAKKEQLMEDRYTEIERENRLLLEKMSTIMQTHHQSRERTTRKRSLNQEFRRREMLKITMENQALLRRLQDRQPSYSIHKWETDRKRTERLLHNICEFPYKLGVTAYIAGVEESRKRYGSVEARMATRSEIGSAPLTRNLMTSRKPGSTNTAGDRPRKLAPIPKDDSKEVLFKRGMNINEKYFLVEVSQVPGLIMITAFDIESPDSYNLELGQREAIELMGGDRNYERLVGMLAFERGELMLVDRRREESPRQHAQTSHRKQKTVKKGSPMGQAKNRAETKERASVSPKQKTPTTGGDTTPDKGKQNTPVYVVEKLTEEEGKRKDEDGPMEEAKKPKSPFASTTPPVSKAMEIEKKEPVKDPMAIESEAFDLSQSADFGPKPIEKNPESAVPHPATSQPTEEHHVVPLELQTEVQPPAVPNPHTEVHEEHSIPDLPVEEQAKAATPPPAETHFIETSSEKPVLATVQEVAHEQTEEVQEPVDDPKTEKEPEAALPEATNEPVLETVEETKLEAAVLEEQAEEVPKPAEAPAHEETHEAPVPVPKAQAEDDPDPAEQVPEAPPMPQKADTEHPPDAVPAPQD